MKRKILIVFCLIAMLLTASCGNDVSRAPAPLPTARVTFREGLTVPECAELLEKNGVCGADEFIAAANQMYPQYEFLTEIENPQDRPFLLEGYLFPDTYEFYCNSAPETVIKKFLDNYKSKITDEYKARADELGYSFDEILRIASIIQEEAIDSEMKTVSSVLHNRLNSDYGRLECDVTVFYIRNSVAPYIENSEKYEELYNAYKFSGLPAGPITNVGINAIEAALYPAQTDYYFFLTDEDMNFHYAVTWAEHSENVKLYYKKSN